VSKYTENAIRFSFNWNNKLDCKAFTTIRLMNDEKYCVGEVYHIYMEEKGKVAQFLGTAELKHKRRESKSELDAFTCYLDTGYSAAETRKILDRMYNKGLDKDLRLDIILLTWIKREPKTT